VLQVQGKHLDTITETASSFNEIQDTQYWLGILNLLLLIAKSGPSNIATDELFIRTLLTIPYNFNFKSHLHHFHSWTSALG
jgi:hypothetical protein